MEKVVDREAGQEVVAAGCPQIPKTRNAKNWTLDLSLSFELWILSFTPITSVTFNFGMQGCSPLVHGCGFDVKRASRAISRAISFWAGLSAGQPTTSAWFELPASGFGSTCSRCFAKTRAWTSARP